MYLIRETEASKGMIAVRGSGWLSGGWLEVMHPCVGSRKSGQKHAHTCQAALEVGQQVFLSRCGHSSGWMRRHTKQGLCCPRGEALRQQKWGVTKQHP